MRIGHSQLDCDKGFDDRHDKIDLKIGETKSTLYPTAKAWRCIVSCRIIPYVLW